MVHAETGFCMLHVCSLIGFLCQHVFYLFLQHAIAYVEGDSYYGAKANINVLGPSIEIPNELNLSQLWVLAGSFEGDLNSIEAGWQVIITRKFPKIALKFTLWMKLKLCVCHR